jgi:hypothetical protein
MGEDGVSEIDGNMIFRQTEEVREWQRGHGVRCEAKREKMNPYGGTN